MICKQTTLFNETYVMGGAKKLDHHEFSPTIELAVNQFDSVAARTAINLQKDDRATLIKEAIGYDVRRALCLVKEHENEGAPKAADIFIHADTSALEWIKTRNREVQNDWHYTQAPAAKKPDKKNKPETVVIPGRKDVDLAKVRGSSDPIACMVQEVLPITQKMVNKMCSALPSALQEEMVQDVLTSLVYERVISRALEKPEEEVVPIIYGAIRRQILHKRKDILHKGINENAYDHTAEINVFEIGSLDEWLSHRSDEKAREVRAERIALIDTLMKFYADRKDNTALTVLRWMMERLNRPKIESEGDGEFDDKTEEEPYSIDTRQNKEAEGHKERGRKKPGIASLIAQETGMPFNTAQNAIHRIKMAILGDGNICGLQKKKSIEKDRIDDERIRAVHLLHSRKQNVRKAGGPSIRQGDKPLAA